jgi:electron transport complex protein RnfG
VTADGYSGNIGMIIGVNFDGTVAGVRVVNHKETPGLGDKVDLKKSDWILSFNGKSLVNPEADGWDVKKNGGEFDQFTGATITPRAVIYQIAQVLEYFSQDSERILAQAAAAASTAKESTNEHNHE